MAARGRPDAAPHAVGEQPGGAGAPPSDHQRYRLRFALRWTLTLFAVVVPSATWGVGTASADASLGPHAARYEVTLDDVITIDLGPLGTVVVDSPLPLVLGARVAVQEIPREVTAVGEASTLTAIGADLQGYIQFFSSPEATLDVVTRSLVADAAGRTLLALVVTVASTWMFRRALGASRRAELVAHLRPHAAAWTVAGVTTLALVLVVTASAPLRDPPGARLGSTSAVFDGTPLEGARITGRLAGVIDTYGGYVVDAYQDNEQFYDRAVQELEVAWAERAEADAALQVSRDAQAGIPSPRPGQEAGEEAGPGQDDDSGAADEAAQTAEPVAVLVVSDLHCNVGMARVIRTAAELSGAEVVLNAGDSTINGTGVEAYCVSAFVGAVPDDATMVVADGNHDSEETSDQERAAGARVLDGEVIEVAGLRILGDGDANATRLGVGTTLVGRETVADQADRLADVACADGPGVDLLLVHNPNLGNKALDQGCVPAQVSGHLHRRIGPVGYGDDDGIRYVSASTAGAALDQATVGPLNGIAELTVLRFDASTRRFTDHRLIRLHPDGEVTVGLAVRWPGSPVVEPFGGPR